MACPKTQSRARIRSFVVAALLFLLHEHCLSPGLGLQNPVSRRFAILLILFVVVAPASRTVLAHSRCSTYIYLIHICIY